MLLSPLGERLGEGKMQEIAFVLTPSPNLSPKGERNMRGERHPRSGKNHSIFTPASLTILLHFMFSIAI
jgi:hypothetical protein